MSRDPKGLKFMSIVGAAYDKAGLSDGEAQRVNDTPGLAERVAAFIAVSRSTDKFKDEETESKHGHPSGCKAPVSLRDQGRQLCILFPGIVIPSLLVYADAGKIKLPTNAEGWFAIPNWKKSPQIFGSTYGEAVQTVLNAIKKDRKGDFQNYLGGSIDDSHLRQSARSEKFWDEFIEIQGNPDILLVPAQFGIRHRGRSIRRVREITIDVGTEFGLGTFAVGIMILTHPIRLQDYDDLWIDCPGDEFSPIGDGDFSHAPYFNFSDSVVRFDARVVSDAHGRYGSASAFVLSDH